MRKRHNNRGRLFRRSTRGGKSPFVGTLRLAGVDYQLEAWPRKDRRGRRCFSLSVKPGPRAKPRAHKLTADAIAQTWRPGR